MKRKFIWHDGQFIDVTDWKRPAPVFPSIIRDTMSAAVHPATGQVLDSKSRFREITKAHGLVEVGTDTSQTTQKARTRDVKSVKKDIAEAWNMVEQGFEAPPVQTVSEWGETRMYGDS